MIIPTIVMPVKANEENPNLALNATVTESSYEIAGYEGSKVVDGNLSTRWGTAQNVANGDWVNLDLGESKTISQIIIRFERPDDGQNIFKYHLELDGTTVWVKEEKAKQVETITFIAPKTARNVKLVIDSADKGTINWLNVGVNEIEVYASNEVALTLDEVINSIAGRTIELDEKTLNLPAVPAGYKVEINGCDFEQIISNDGTINHPLTDKEVQMSYKVTKVSTGESKITNDITYIVSGQYEVNENNNAKPVIIPEIQEWVSDSQKLLAIKDIT